MSKNNDYCWASFYGIDPSPKFRDNVVLEIRQHNGVTYTDPFQATVVKTTPFLVKCRIFDGGKTKKIPKLSGTNQPTIYRVKQIIDST